MKNGIEPHSIPILDIISGDQVRAAITACEEFLMNSPRISLQLSRDWMSGFPTSAGIYTIFDDDQLVYIGETGCICKLIVDLLHTQNHSLRRSIGNTMFKNQPGFKVGTANQSFPRHIKNMLIDYFETHLLVSVVVVHFGRFEIEEHLIHKYRPKYNCKGKRGTKLRARDSINSEDT